MIDKFIESLKDLKKAIKSKNEKKLERIFTKTKKIRKEIVKAGQDISKPDFGRKQNQEILLISSQIFFSTFWINSSRLRPGFIGFKNDTVILPGCLVIPCFGQTLPEFNATGTQEIFKAQYILPTPFLKGTLSLKFTLVP